MNTDTIYCVYKEKYTHLFFHCFPDPEPKNLGISFVMRTIKVSLVCEVVEFGKTLMRPEWALIAQERTAYRRVSTFIPTLPLISYPLLLSFTQPQGG